MPRIEAWTSLKGFGYDAFFPADACLGIDGGQFRVFSHYRIYQPEYCRTFSSDKGLIVPHNCIELSVILRQVSEAIGKKEELC